MDIMKFFLKFLDVCFIILINSFGKILVIKVNLIKFKVVVLFLVCY